MSPCSTMLGITRVPLESKLSIVDSSKETTIARKQLNKDGS